ncbi:Uncharacterized protein TPAR_04007 [Tolypocladium paradoxum]|uniref:Chromo domain-containing protein n=1 Tax=Tolypocladium paradoxum TaxID=94208 RepID=A0A2S4L069_9HYPO|nr:Uncharacterized protein TPAR_04007 [Tolypocladium paradoxum]
MPRPAHKLSVFIGREIRVDRDEVEMLVTDWAHRRIRPSIERSVGSPEDVPLVTSDIVRNDYVAYDETGRISRSNGSEGSLSGSSRASRSKELEPQPSAPATPRRKRQRTRHQDRRETFPRRSTRIRATTITKPAPAPAATKPKKRVAKKVMSTPSRNASGEWEVEKIVDSRIEEGTFKHFYLVKWKGFASKDNTWEPKTNVAHCWAAIEAYEKGAK